MIPISYSGISDHYGNYMELYEIRSNPIEKVWKCYGTDPHTQCYGESMELYEIRSNPIEEGQLSYGFGMVLTHIIPIPDTMGNIWNFTKYVAIP